MVAVLSVVVAVILSDFITGIVFVTEIVSIVPTFLLGFCYCLMMWQAEKAFSAWLKPKLNTKHPPTKTF